MHYFIKKNIKQIKKSTFFSRVTNLHACVDIYVYVGMRLVGGENKIQNYTIVLWCCTLATVAVNQNAVAVIPKIVCYPLDC